MPPLKKSIWYRRAVERGDIDPSEEDVHNLQTEEEPDDERAPAAVRRKVDRNNQEDPIVFDLDPDVYDSLARGDLVPVFAKNSDPPPNGEKLVPIPKAASIPREQPPGPASSLKKNSPSRQKAVSWDPDVASIRARTEQVGGSSSSSRPPAAPEPYGGSTTSKAKAPLTARKAAHSGGKSKTPPEEKVFPDFDPIAGLYPDGPPDKEDFAAHIQADRIREYGVSDPLPAYIRGQIAFQKETSAADLLKKNRRNTKWLMKLAKETEEENAKVMKSLKPHLQQVYEGKNFVLFEKLLDQVCGFVRQLRDNKAEVMSIIPKLKEGFRNTGKVEPCGFWKKLPYSKIEEKKQLAASTNLETYRRHPQHEHWAEERLIETMWRQKEAMVAKGLWKEAKPEDVGKLGASKAFPVEQGNPVKVRTCIDYRAQNNTLVVEEKMRLLNARAAMCAVKKFMSPLDTRRQPDYFQFRQTINSDVMDEKLIREQISQHREIAETSHEAASSGNLHEKAVETKEMQQQLSISDDESYVFNPYHSKDDLEQFYYQSGSFDPAENAVWMPVPYSVSHPAPQDQPLGPPDVNATPREAGTKNRQQPAAQPRDPAAAPTKKTPSGTAAPRHRSWQLILSLVALFGSLSSVRECVAVSECLQAIIARFQVYGTVYIDDIHIMSRPTVADSDQKMIHLLLALLGWRRSAAKHESMHTLIQKCLIVLGVSYTWISESELLISIDSKKVAELIALGTKLLLDARLEMKDIERFRGLYRHCMQLSRSQVFLARALDRWCVKEKFSKLVGGKKNRQSLLQSIRTMKTAAERLRPYSLTTYQQARTIIHCYTDAALENLEGLNAAIAAGQSDLSEYKMVIGGFLYISEHDQRAFQGTLTSLPPSIHKMNIGILESLAARIAVDLWSAVMSNHFVVLHVDNLGDVFALARNSARCDITQNIVAAFHNIQYEKSLQVYTTWICTERNVADVLTREVRSQVLRTSFPQAVVQTLTLEQLHMPRIWNTNSATTSGPSSCLA